MRQRLLEPSRVVEQVAASVGCVPMAGRELERMLKAEQRIGRPLQIDQNVAEVFPEPPLVGPELDRLVERLQRLLVASLLLQRGAEAREYSGLGFCRMAREIHSSA